MGVSEVLLCPYRSLFKRYNGKLGELKIQLCFYSRFPIILLHNRTQVLVMPSVSNLFLNEFTEGAVMAENGRLFHTFVILMLNEYFRRL